MKILNRIDLNNKVFKSIFIEKTKWMTFLRTLDEMMIDLEKLPEDVVELLAIFDVLLNSQFGLLISGRIKKENENEALKKIEGLKEKFNKLQLLIILYSGVKQENFFKIYKEIRVGFDEVLQPAKQALLKDFGLFIGVDSEGIYAGIPENKEEVEKFLSSFQEIKLNRFDANGYKKVNSIEITLNESVHSFLRKFPNHWIRAIAEVYGIEQTENREKLEEKILESLTHKDKVLKIINEKLPSSSRSILTFLLNRKYVSLERLRLKFGGEDKIDSFFWDIIPPRSPFGILRYCGFAFVGRLKDTKENIIVFIPDEIKKTIIGDKIE